MNLERGLANGWRGPATLLRACLLALGIGLAAGAAGAEGEGAGRAGVVQFSNGVEKEGTLALTPGSDLKVHVGAELRRVDFATVHEIRLAPTQERMERHWRFAEAGRTEKQVFGKPYPVRQLEATVVLDGGEVLRGHLYTTVLYVEGAERTEKVILLAKQQGQEGETFDQLPYPVRVAFRSADASVGGALRVTVTKAEGKTEVAALTRGGLVRLEAQPAGAGGVLELPSALGAELIWGVRDARRIVVGWPGAGTATDTVRLTQALEDARDFFDSRMLLGVWRDEADGALYTLLLLVRRGATSLSAERSQPWQVNVWRWRENEDGKLMLAGRGWLFRGIAAKDAPPPTVRLSPLLWAVKAQDGAVLEAGE